MKITAQKIIKSLAISLAIFAVSVTFTYFSLQKVHAQEAQRTITIVPPSEDITVNPGDKTEGVLKVINDSNQSLTFTASTQDFIVNDTHGTPDFLPQDTLGKPFSAASWIGVVPDTFTVNPGQKVILNYYIQVPKNARPGGHYAGVIYSPTTLFGAKGSGAAVQTQIGTLFSIDVSGPIHEQAYVSNFTGQGFHEYGPVNILTEIKNMGDLHIKPIGNITITNLFGQKIATLPLEEHNIFPTAARDYVNIFGQHWMIGPFTAHFVAAYGRNGNLPLLATVTFWVFPWKVVVVILLLVIAAVMGYFVWKQRRSPKEPTTHEGHEHHAEENTHTEAPVTPEVK